MRNKKSVLKTLSVSYDCSNGAVTGIAGNGKVLAYRKKVLFDITSIPNALFLTNNNGSNGYWINRKWLSESRIKELIINEPKQVDVSNLQWYQQENLNHVFNLK